MSRVQPCKTWKFCLIHFGESYYHRYDVSIVPGDCVWGLSVGHVFESEVCAWVLWGSVWRGQRERWTYQHHLDRVHHELHIGLQDVRVKGWGQHAPMLEPLLPFQQEQTIYPGPEKGVKMFSGNRGNWAGLHREQMGEFRSRELSWGFKKNITRYRMQF